MAMEGKTEGFKTKMENATSNVNNRPMTTEKGWVMMMHHSTIDKELEKTLCL